MTICSDLWSLKVQWKIIFIFILVLHKSDIKYRSFKSVLLLRSLFTVTMKIWNSVFFFSWSLCQREILGQQLLLLLPKVKQVFSWIPCQVPTWTNISDAGNKTCLQYIHQSQHRCCCLTVKLSSFYLIGTDRSWIKGKLNSAQWLEF